MDNIVATVSAITIALSAFVSPAPSASLSAQEVHEEPYIIHVVELGESLGTIAIEELGSSDHWTTLWNHNSEIKNSDLIEKGDKIKIPKDSPKEPEELRKELSEKLEARTIVSVAPSATPAGAVAVPQNTPSSLTEAQISFLGNCESGMTATRNSGNGYYGAFQFSIGTWNSMGTGYERADLAPLEVQKDAVQRLVARSSIFGQFPGCSARMRSLGLI